MKTLLLIFLFATVDVFAAQKINVEYSYRNFTDVQFTEVDPKDLDNKIIIGSCFYQTDSQEHIIFPEDVKKITFVASNLDNVDMTTCDRCTVDESNTNEYIVYDGQSQEDYFVDKITKIKIKKVKDD